LKLWSPKLKNGWKSVKYRAHSDDFEHILWEARWPKENLINEYNNYVSQGLPDLYSQEYLNIPLDEASAYFKRFDFEQETEEEKKLSLTYYVTVDLAISHDSRADYSVFIVSGVDENRKIHVKQVIRERLDAREIVDCILELERIYKPACFGIEDMQVSKSIGPFLYEEMAKQNTYPNIVLMKHGGKDKIARGKSIQARMRARAVCFDKQADWYPTFEDELLKFPRGTHDDCVDAFAYLGMLLNKLVEAPTQEEQDEDIYADEFTDAHSFNGRNGTTGY
jgi:predicted phage terminase large subunit-like protein